MRDIRAFLLDIWNASSSFDFFFPGARVQERVSLCYPDCLRTHSVDQAGLKLRVQPASAS